MKAAVLAGYAKNGCDLELRELPIPKAAPGEVLVKVHAAGVNPLDNMIVRGEVKLIVPYSFPLVMGNELVGTVVELGAGSSRFTVGDRVYGRMPLSKIGAFSEYASVNEFVHEDGAGLEKLPEILGDRRIEASVDMVFPFDEVNAAMAKVAAGRSKGKTVLKIC